MSIGYAKAPHPCCCENYIATPCPNPPPGITVVPNGPIPCRKSVLSAPAGSTVVDPAPVSLAGCSIVAAGAAAGTRQPGSGLGYRHRAVIQRAGTGRAAAAAAGAGILVRRAGTGRDAAALGILGRGVGAPRAAAGVPGPGAGMARFVGAHAGARRVPARVSTRATGERAAGCRVSIGSSTLARLRAVGGPGDIPGIAAVAVGAARGRQGRRDRRARGVAAAAVVAVERALASVVERSSRRLRCRSESAPCPGGRGGTYGRGRREWR